MLRDQTTKNFIRNRPSKNAIVVNYAITTDLDFETATLKLCKEQSLSNALGSDMSVIRKYSAKYIPESIKKISRRRFKVDVIFPQENHENSLSMLMSAAGGDTFNIKNLYPIKIQAIKIPRFFTRSYKGPRYGVDGLRQILRVYRRPILLGPVKPCVGMSPRAFAEQAKEALLGGADIVKDDELICDPVYSRLYTRVKMVSRVVKETAKITGERKMYFAFIGSGTPTQIIRNAEVAKKAGADGFMVSPAINGLEIVKELRERFTMPIIAHNAFMYSAYTKNHGVAFGVLAFLQRLCGADIVITPAKYGTFDIMTREEHRENISALLRGFNKVKRSFPAFCGGQSSKSIPLLKQDVGNTNFVLVAGSALYDHPGGPRAGSQLLREAFHWIKTSTGKQSPKN